MGLDTTRQPCINSGYDRYVIHQKYKLQSTEYGVYDAKNLSGTHLRMKPDPHRN